MRNLRGTVLLAWVICAIVSILAIFGSVSAMVASRESGRPLPLDWIFLEGVTPLFFSVPAALIISRQPRNIIGWLLMTPALPLSRLSSSVPTWRVFKWLLRRRTFPSFMIWISSISWLALILPLLLIPVLFPTGRPLSRRWRWVLYLAIAMILFLFFWRPVRASSNPNSPPGRWKTRWVFSARNRRYPYAALGRDSDGAAASSLASILIRYRRAPL